MNLWLGSDKGYFIDWLTQLWVKVTGHKFAPDVYPWLIGPHGNTNLIKDIYVQHLANDNNLRVVKNHLDFGLVESIADYNLSKTDLRRLNPKIIDFYETTINYEFEVWSKWCGAFYPFGWLVNLLFSRRLQQLNLPLDPMDTSLGISSEIIKLKDNDDVTHYTVWYRILKSRREVIYSGVYTTCYLPKIEKTCLKVVFPLPNGNATVIMSINIMEDGALDLRSDGTEFGEPGFYLTLTDHTGNYWAKYLPSFHENIYVYEDKEGIVRANHNLKIWGMYFLKLHYRINAKSSQSNYLPEQIESSAPNSAK